MTTAVGGIVVDIDARLTRLEASLSKANSDLGKFGANARRHAASVNGSLERLEGAFGRLRTAAGGLVAVFAGTALAYQIRRSLEYASSLGEVSEQLGVTTRDLQIYRYAATQVNLAQEEVDRSLARLSLNIGRAGAGSVQQAEAFRVLGISVRNTNGHLKTAGEVMPELADAIQRIRDPASRAAVLVELFGRAGQQLLPLLKDGAPALRQYADDADRLGMVLSDSEIANADRTADKIDQLNLALSANLSRIVAQNADSILQLATSLATLAAGIARFMASNPERALGLLGALGGASIGARIAGPWGAAIGGGVGFLGGSRLGATDADDARHMDSSRYQQMEIRVRTMGMDPRRMSRADLARARADPTIQRFQRDRVQAQDTIRRANLPPPTATTLTPPPLDVGNFMAPSGGSHHDDSDRLRKEALRRAHEIETEQRRAQMDILREQQDQLGDVVERTSIGQDLLQLEKQQQDSDRAFSVAMDERTQTEADALGERQQQLYLLQKQSLNMEMDQRVSENRFRMDQDALDAQQEALRGQEELARTASERRSIELRILGLAEQEERQRLEHIRDNEQLDHEEREAARRRLETLGTQFANRRAGVMNSTMGPLQQYFDQLPRSAAEMQEALEGVAVNGLQTIEEGLTSILMGTESVADGFRRMAASIIADLIRIQIQQMIMRALGPALGMSGGDKSGSIIGAIGAVLGGVGGAKKGFASGGRPPIGQWVMVGEKGPELMKFDQPGTIFPNHRMPSLAKAFSGLQPANDRGDPVHIHFHGPVDRAQARQSGNQAANAYQRRIAAVRRVGLA